jgi:2-aminobenzoate-CoA ligase
MELSPSAHVDTFTRENLPPQETWPVFEFTLPELQYPERLNAATALLDDTIARHGADRVALRTPEGETWSYGDLLAAANRIAHVLVEDHGIVPGNRVMLRMPNNPWAVACWLAVLKAGAVVVTTMTAWKPTEIERIVGKTRPSAIIVDHRFVDDLRTALGDTVDTIVVGGEGDELTAAMADKSALFDDVATAADDVALLGPTSGTTGMPKVTMHFHRDILANADTFAKHIVRMQPDDLCAGSAPLAFTFGLGGLVVFPLRFGAATLLVEKATPIEFAELTERYGVTVLYTAPTAYRAILKEGKGDALRGLRVGVSAGEHLPKETWEGVEAATGIRLVDGIGSTELLHVFISAAGDDIRPGATGKAVPGYRATILGENGEELGPNEIGRLGVIGPTGCRYLDDDRQANYVSGGWNVTGDTYLRDDDGYFHYQARSDSMIVTAGYNVGAPEVETAIDQHPDVLESAVVGRPDPDRGMVIAAYVVPREGVEPGDALAESIKAFVKERLAIYKCPRRVDFVTELPRNPSGKLQHFRLRERAAADAAASGATTQGSTA